MSTLPLHHFPNTNYEVHSYTFFKWQLHISLIPIFYLFQVFNYDFMFENTLILPALQLQALCLTTSQIKSSVSIVNTNLQC